VHGFSTRKGGESVAPFDTLNLGLSLDDDKKVVLCNREKFFRTLGYSSEETSSLNQVHKDTVQLTDESHKGKWLPDKGGIVEPADAMVTNQPGILLVAYYADCVPLYFFDPKKRALGIAHAGWRGTVLKIGAKTIKEMTRCFGTDPQDCIAVVGPSIGSCCYEVDEKVLNPIKESYGNNTDIIKKDRGQNAHLDLWEANKVSLLEANLKDTNIYISGLCTHCNEKYFFSHRRDKGRTGRMAAAIGLRR
jgi:YfiH family protein